MMYWSWYHNQRDGRSPRQREYDTWLESLTDRSTVSPTLPQFIGMVSIELKASRNNEEREQHQFRLQGVVDSAPTPQAVNDANLNGSTNRPESPTPLQNTPEKMLRVLHLVREGRLLSREWASAADNQGTFEVSVTVKDKKFRGVFSEHDRSSNPPAGLFVKLMSLYGEEVKPHTEDEQP
jgi:hypothetical protein